MLSLVCPPPLPPLPLCFPFSVARSKHVILFPEVFPAHDITSVLYFAC